MYGRVMIIGSKTAGTRVMLGGNVGNRLRTLPEKNCGDHNMLILLGPVCRYCRARHSREWRNRRVSACSSVTVQPPSDGVQLAEAASSEFRLFVDDIHAVELGHPGVIGEQGTDFIRGH